VREANSRLTYVGECLETETSVTRFLPFGLLLRVVVVKCGSFFQSLALTF